VDHAVGAMADHSHDGWRMLAIDAMPCEERSRRCHVFGGLAGKGGRQWRDGKNQLDQYRHMERT
jgi:hypothetical protein